MTKYKGKRINKNKWYTLCVRCFCDLYEQGGWCPARGEGKYKVYPCSFCGGRSEFEFYPMLSKEDMKPASKKLMRAFLKIIKRSKLKK